MNTLLYYVIGGAVTLVLWWMKKISNTVALISLAVTGFLWYRTYSAGNNATQ